MQDIDKLCHLVQICKLSRFEDIKHAFMGSAILNIYDIIKP